MLDHAFLEVVAMVRQAFADALLERQVPEERLALDVLLGDIVWESSYSLPGEGTPPRVQADVALEWTTWSQSLFRSWSLGEHPEEFPEIGVELVLRVQRLAGPVGTGGLGSMVEQLAPESPPLAGALLERSGPVVEEAYEDGLATSRPAVEFTYDGAVVLDADLLADRHGLSEPLQAFGRWVASALVRLGDLPFEYLPPEAASEG